MYDHFEGEDLFHQNHHGFLGHHSTATALIQLYDLWVQAADRTELSAALLLDLTAAFDVVDHSILLRKLDAYNFSEESVLWFSSYLSERQQYVQVESKVSQCITLNDYCAHHTVGPPGLGISCCPFEIFYGRQDK